VFGKDATAEFDRLVHQVTQYVFAFLADGRYVLRFGVWEVANHESSFQLKCQLDLYGEDRR
jgi:hypothetical protein